MKFGDCGLAVRGLVARGSGWIDEDERGEGMRRNGAGGRESEKGS